MLTVNSFTAKPDRFEEAVEEVRKIKTVVEKHGGKNVRLLAALVAGQATGSLAFIIEADTFAANGALTDKFLADPEGMAQMAAGNSSAGAITGTQTTQWVEIPL